MNASSFRHSINAFLTVQFAVHKSLLVYSVHFAENLSLITTTARHLGDMKSVTLVRIRREFGPNLIPFGIPLGVIAVRLNL
jgi:hypothetical protein